MRHPILAILGIAAFVTGLGFVTVSAWPFGGPPSVSSYRPYAAPPGNPEQGRQVVKDYCANCHGADGNSADAKYPKLAGQDPAYLYQQLRAFKSGERRNQDMTTALTDLSETDLDDAVSFYSEQRRRPSAVVDPVLAAQGERIFFEASGYPGIPSCAACHDGGGGRGMPMMGGGMMSGGGMMGSAGTGPVPDLNGQHAAYILDQLNRFATGERRDGIMNRIAGMMHESQRRAVAEYLSGLH